MRPEIPRYSHLHTRKAKEKAGQDHIMVLETTGLDGMNPWISTKNERRTLQLKMNNGKKTNCTPGMQEQRTHEICPGNLQKHHGILK